MKVMCVRIERDQNTGAIIYAFIQVPGGSPDGYAMQGEIRITNPKSGYAVGAVYQCTLA